MRILLVEDNQRLSAALKAQLEKDGYAVDALPDGAQGLAFAEEIAYDLIILDIMLPKKDGLTICRELREERINTPVLMLTARDTVTDRILATEIYCDQTNWDVLTADGMKQRVVIPYSVEQIKAGDTIQIWGNKRGDRLVAEIILVYPER